MPRMYFRIWPIKPIRLLAVRLPNSLAKKIYAQNTVWHLSVFGLQSQLVPADGLDVAGLGQDLDAFGGLHDQGAGG